MRVSTSQIYNIATLGMTQAQSAVTKTQEQMASGKRLLSPGEDPVASVSILRLNQELARTEQFGKNINIAENNLNLEESTLQTVVGLVQRMRDMAVTAGNTAVYKAVDYKAMAAEVDTRIAELLNLQNTRNASGQYIFAGYQGDKVPFVDASGGNYGYQGDEGQLRLQVSSSVKVAVSDSGKRVFVDIPSGHNTFDTRPSESNRAVPGAVISVGEVIDQKEFDKLYPADMQVSFSKIGTTVHVSVSEKSSGKMLMPAQPYFAGEAIEVAGARFTITGDPYAGEAALPATLALPATFTAPMAAGDQIGIRVGNRTEMFTMSTAITSAADLENELNNPANGHLDRLGTLGVSVSPAGFTQANGLNIQLVDGAVGPNVNTLFGGQSMRSVSIPFGAGVAMDFSQSPTSFQITSNGRTETITLSRNVTGIAPDTLANAINASTNASALARLGVVATDDGFASTQNARITVSGGNTVLDAAMGFNTRDVGTSSSQGVPAVAGDSFFVESTDKQGLLTTLSRFSQALKSVQDTAASKSELSELVAKTLTNLSNVTNSITSVQGELGARLNTLDSSKDLNADIILSTKTVLSSLESVDYADASIKLTMQSLVLNAAQQSFAKVSQLTLFSYL
jgi:flagellar hook-associated protein 3 FlgL